MDNHEYVYAYFEWLLDYILRYEEDRDKTLTDEIKDMLWEMLQKEFLVVNERDENRVGDAIELRSYYLEETHQTESPIGIDLDIRPVTVLEVLIAFADRIERDVAGEPGNDHPERWFWIMLTNLGLIKVDEKLMKLVRTEVNVDESMEIFMHRLYRKDGFGGLFPLKNPPVNQKSVEMWLQMQSYLMENFPVE